MVATVAVFPGCQLLQIAKKSTKLNYHDGGLLFLDHPLQAQNFAVKGEGAEYSNDWTDWLSQEELMKFHLRSTGCHLPYGITQCYLPPDTSERTSIALTPTRGRYSILTPEG